MASIQFRGVDKLIEGYENTKAPCWSIWESKRMITKGAGKDMLETFLDLLVEGSTNSQYILRIYEEVTDPIKIKENTPCDGSFGFILHGNTDEITHPIYSYKSNTNKLFERLGSIEQQMQLLQAPAPDPEPEGETFESIAMDYLKNPHKIQGLINTGKSLLGIKITEQEAAIGAIGAAQEAAQQTQTSDAALSPDMIARAQAAINTLQVGNPRIVEQLEKLARIKTNQPSQWTFLINLLENMP